MENENEKEKNKKKRKSRSQSKSKTKTKSKNKTKRQNSKSSKTKSKLNLVSNQFKIANDFDEKGMFRFLKEKDKHLKEMKLKDNIEEAKRNKESNITYENEEYFIKVSIDSDADNNNNNERIYSFLPPIKGKEPHRVNSNLPPHMNIFNSDSEKKDIKSFSIMLSGLK